MMNKIIIKLVPFLLVLSLQARRKEIEECLLAALKGSEQEFLFLQDLKMLSSMSLEFQLLPEEVRKLTEACMTNFQNDLCKEKLNSGDYEACGMIVVPKCPEDYNRVDCTICAKKCPVQTKSVDNGFVCEKPKFINRKRFESNHKCVMENVRCDQYKKFALEKCPINYQILGQFMCSYQCPRDFVDDGIYCVPPRVINNEVCTSSYHEKYSNNAQAL